MPTVWCHSPISFLIILAQLALFARDFGRPLVSLYTRGVTLRFLARVQGEAIDAIRNREDGAWPVELQNEDCYTRAGTGALDKVRSTTLRQSSGALISRTFGTSDSRGDPS